jgi:hypothetical protein
MGSELPSEATPFPGLRPRRRSTGTINIRKNALVTSAFGEHRPVESGFIP